MALKSVEHVQWVDDGAVRVAPAGAATPADARPLVASGPFVVLFFLFAGVFGGALDGDAKSRPLPLAAPSRAERRGDQSEAEKWGGGGFSFHRVLKEKKGSFHFAARVFIELRNRVDRRKNPKRKPVRDWRKGKKTAMQQEEKDEKKQTNKTHHEEEEEEEEHGNVDDKFSRPEQRRNTETNDGEPSIAANNTQRHVGISSGREFLS